ncbi:hypothetical protein Hypma_008452 [Hypsizygus marmoreus]|uniref:Uncharacterized protein n=1 Tax=Hypsizygus marmoreus TaxID=39966 RepID=A0A369JVL9_HYPMA|nr:hypothetical protein Hypma_008452 [Hypsizygus marmoreus]
MPVAVVGQYPPAVKVGGRRLSVTSKPKHHAATEPAATIEPTPAADNVDYPRPVAHGGEQVQANPPPYIEEEAPLKRDKHSHDVERQLREFAQRKDETTRPSKDMTAGHKGFGAAGRIAQPAGKSFGV